MPSWFDNDCGSAGDPVEIDLLDDSDRLTPRNVHADRSSSTGGVMPRLEFATRLDAEGTTVRLVRELACGGRPLLAAAVWSQDYGDVSTAEAAFEAIGAHAQKFEHWGVAAQAMGAGWLAPTLADIVDRHVEEVREERERLARDKAAEEAKAERKRLAAVTISAHLRERKGRFVIDLDRGGADGERIWSTGFDERWERDRLWDWLRWRTERFEEFAAFLREAGDLDLERRLLREMLATEQLVKKQGLGSGGRRPLRFWRGAL